MADQTGGSPWDEPMPEATQPKLGQPTVIGDFAAGQTITPATGQAAPAARSLNVPKNVSEPVGAKIAAASVADQPPPAPIPAPTQPKPTAPAPDIQPPPRPAPAAPPPVADMSHLYQPVPVGRQAVPAATPVPAAAGQAPKPAQVPLTPPAAGQAPAAGARKPGGSKLKIIIAGILGLIVLLAGGIFLTEEGMISIGLEKVYGVVRLESLWGGLPANPETAFALSAIKMKGESNFKASGDSTSTVNKSIKSNIISPIVSASAFPLLSLKSDQSVSGIAALLTAVGSAATPPAASSLGTSGSSTSSIISNQEVTADISAKFGSEISGATINLKTSSNPNGEIDLVYAKNKLYLKGSSGIVYDQSVKNGWVSYDLTKNNVGIPSVEFWSSSFSGSSFSVTGSRVGNEKINGVRCYHYFANVNIGDALSTFGLSEDSVQSLDFDFWAGVADHRIYQIKAKIIPNANAAVSRIDLQLNFSDFGSEGGNYSVPATSTLSSGSKVGQTSPDTPAARDSQKKSDLLSISKALDQYRQSYNTYPLSSGNEKIAAGSGTLYQSLVPTFISTLPLDPGDPKYYYGYESDGTKYTLSAVLEVATDPDGKTVGGKHLYFLKSQ